VDGGGVVFGGLSASSQHVESFPIIIVQKPATVAGFRDITP
jgi:hypothetical protein